MSALREQYDRKWQRRAAGGVEGQAACGHRMVGSGIANKREWRWGGGDQLGQIERDKKTKEEEEEEDKELDGTNLKSSFPVQQGLPTKGKEKNPPCQPGMAFALATQRAKAGGRLAGGWRATTWHATRLTEHNTPHLPTSSVGVWAVGKKLQRGEL